MGSRADGVVVGVDESDGALNAARWAGVVAARLGKTLHIVHGLGNVGHQLTGTVAAIRAAATVSQRDSAETIVRSAVAAVHSQSPDLKVTALSTDMPVVDILLQLTNTARMIVVGGSHVTAAGALFLGSTTLAVATRASCPVVAWRGQNTAPTDQPIVVGVDESPSCTSALENAFEFAERFGVKLAAVHAWRMRCAVGGVSNPLLIDWDLVATAVRRQLTDRVDRHSQRHPDVEVSCNLETSDPSSALLNQIDLDGAQLVVVGNRGRNTLTSAVLGSTTLNLLHHSPVPVMICRAPQ
ncbi:universal stress protein [Mycolicibacterium agri]|nr:universal stress protein [Mycolicibacterium agri]PEG33786.1 universal stress protein [Mycolicibacterium agri]